MTNYKRREDDPLVQWQASHQLDLATSLLISRWLEVAIAMERAIVLAENFRDWLPHQEGEAPDLVACVAWYGYALYGIADWRETPIVIPEEEHERWREAGYWPTMRDIEERLAGVAGGTLELIGRNPDFSVDIIIRQIEQKITTMREQLVEELDYLEDRHYKLDDFDDEEEEDGSDTAEQDWFDRPFVLYQQLMCFEYGLEHLRMLCLENAPELGLPNKELDMALNCRIRSNWIMACLDEVEGVMRRILGRMAKQNYFKLDLDYEPEVFWWRHWEDESKKKRSK